MKIGIIGISGKMGRACVRAVFENELTDVAGGLVRSDSNLKGKDIGEAVGLEKVGVVASDNLEELFQNSDAVIDFSNPALTLESAKLASKHKKILVSGTTGFTEAQKQQLASYAVEAQIVWSANMSVGVNLLIALSEKIAKILHDDFDAEVLEMHHREKIDAPSGTALALGEAIAKGRGLNFGEVSRKTREGMVGKRSKTEIGFASLRGGDVIGDHTVIFAGIGERVELSHKASNRDIYARGALRACIWASGQKPGFYSMRDVLGEIR